MPKASYERLLVPAVRSGPLQAGAPKTRVADFHWSTALKITCQSWLAPKTRKIER